MPTTEEVRRILDELRVYDSDYRFSVLLLFVEDGARAQEVVEAMPPELVEPLARWLRSFTRPPLDPHGMFASPDEAWARMKLLDQALRDVPGCPE